jgi:membrane-bound lytic murein transglycosylase B
VVGRIRRGGTGGAAGLNNGRVPAPQPEPGRNVPAARRRHLQALLACAGLALAPLALAGGPPRAPDHRSPPPGLRYGSHPAAQTFVAEVAARRGLPAEWLQAALADAHRVQRVRELIMPPPAGTAKDWAAYRARFVEPRRVAAGVAFWRGHEAWLAEAEQRWGVPAEVVVAIVGIETFYGRITGSFRVVDALATLAFEFPAGGRDRSAFFREQLEEYLVWCRREGLAPGRTRGSYAGAIGLPQFMPGSINRYAIDMDGDGHIDLLRQPADVVGSVAHYLAEHGWQRGLPTHFGVAVPVDTADRAALLAPDIRPTFSAEQLQARGAVLPEAARGHPGLMALVELQNGAAAPSFVLGTTNFWALTRYNWSAYYAMAVIDLAAELRRAAARRP